MLKDEKMQRVLLQCKGAKYFALAPYVGIKLNGDVPEILPRGFVLYARKEILVDKSGRHEFEQLAGDNF